MDTFCCRMPDICGERALAIVVGGVFKVGLAEDMAIK